MMQDTIEISGTRYLSSKSAADKTGYSADHIARLAHSGEVQGKRLGGMWFVEEDALHTYLFIRQKESAAERMALSQVRRKEYQKHRKTSGRSALLSSDTRAHRAATALALALMLALTAHAMAPWAALPLIADVKTALGDTSATSSQGTQVAAAREAVVRAVDTEEVDTTPATKASAAPAYRSQENQENAHKILRGAGVTHVRASLGHIRSRMTEVAAYLPRAVHALVQRPTDVGYAMFFGISEAASRKFASMIASIHTAPSTLSRAALVDTKTEADTLASLVLEDVAENISLATGTLWCMFTFTCSDTNEHRYAWVEETPEPIGEKVTETYQAPDPSPPSPPAPAQAPRVAYQGAPRFASPPAQTPLPPPAPPAPKQRAAPAPPPPPASAHTVSGATIHTREVVHAERSMADLVSVVRAVLAVDYTGLTEAALFDLADDLRAEIDDVRDDAHRSVSRSFETLPDSDKSFLDLTDTPSRHVAGAIPYTNAGGTALTTDGTLVYTGSRLGVGTSTPAGTLAVGGDSFLGGNLILTGNFTADADTLVLDAALNRVGVGTTSPMSMLSVAGDQTLTGALHLLNSSPAATTNRLYANAGTLYWAGNVVGGSSVGNWATDGTHVWRAAGNVGIGTTTPLDLAGVNGSLGLGTINTNAIVNVRNAGNSASLQFEFPDLSSAGAGVVRLFRDTNTTGPLAFKIYKGDNSSSIQTWLSGGIANSYLNALGGNVGIGTTNPGAKLEVSGITRLSNPNGTALQIQRGDNTANYHSIRTDSASGLIFNTAGASSNYQLQVNGTERVRIDNQGNVGIGTTSPDSILHVRDTYPIFTFTDDTNANWTEGQGIGAISFNLSDNTVAEKRAGSIALINDRTGTVSHPSSAFAFSTMVTGNAPSEVLRISSSGNVGIGTTGPGSKLSVNGGISAGSYSATAAPSNGMIISGNVGIGTTNPGAKLDVSSNSSPAFRISDTRTTILDDESIGNIEFYGSDASGSGAGVKSYIKALADPQGTAGRDYKLVFGTGANNTLEDKLVIDSTGNVGIGTSTPAEKLQVSITDNSAYTGSESSNATPTGIVANFQNYTAVSDTFSGISFETRNGRKSYIGGLTTGGDYGNAIVFGQQTGISTFSEYMRIDSRNGYKGNVGIGTTNPTAKLDISQGNLDIDSTTFANQKGIITKDGTRFIHDFNYGNNGTVTTAGQNTFVGKNAGNLTMGATAVNNYEASYNTGIGENALLSNTTGYYNSAVGTNALRSNTTGYFNSAVGMYALRSNTTGSSNSAMGMSALYSNTTGFYNSAMGMNALYYNTSATFSTAIGYRAAQGTANYNAGELTVIGADALYNLTTGAEDNTALGYRAGYGNTSGANNIYLGYQAGDNVTTGSNNIILGYNVDAPSATASNQLNIGNAIYGNLATGNVGVGTTTPWAKLSVRGTGTGKALVVADSANTPRLVVQDNGLVGVGTIAAPSNANTKLYVNGAIELTDNLLMPNYSNVLWNYATGIYGDGDGASGRLSFTTNFVERIRVTGNGNVGIGTTNPSTFKLQIAGNVGPNADDTYNLGAAGSDWGCLYYNSGTLGTCASDERLKENIETLDFGENALEQIAALAPKSFSFRSDDSHSRYHGLIAQDVLLAAPALVATTSDGTLTVKYGDLQWLMLGALQELNEKVSRVALGGSALLDAAGERLEAKDFSMGSTSFATSSMLVFVDPQYHFQEDRFYVDATTGRVGLGTTSPAYALHVEGDVGAQAFVNISTKEEKKHIAALEEDRRTEMLAALGDITLKEYRYRTEGKNAPLRLGLIAEEAPAEVLSLDGKGVDLYKLTSLTLLGTQDVRKRVSYLEETLGISFNALAASSSNMLATTTPEHISPFFATMVGWFERFGITLELGLARLTDIFVKTATVEESLTVGTSEKPTGLVLYDEATGEPYCVRIVQGRLQQSVGDCSQSAPLPLETFPEPEPAPEPTSAPTDPPAPSSEPEVIPEPVPDTEETVMLEPEAAPLESGVAAYALPEEAEEAPQEAPQEASEESMAVESVVTTEGA